MTQESIFRRPDALEQAVDSGRLTTALLMLISAGFACFVFGRISEAAWLSPLARGLSHAALAVILAASLGGLAFQRARAAVAELAGFGAIAGVGVGLLALTAIWAGLTAPHGPSPVPSYFLSGFVFGAMALTGVRSSWLLPLAFALLAADAAAAHLWATLPGQAELVLLGDLTAAAAGSAACLRLRQLHHRESQRAQQALEDPLTGLGNRRAFEREAGIALSMASREQRPVTLAMIDVDRFKLVNDSFGHPAGDAALRSIADSLRRHARRPLDSCVRLGGDEFAVLWFDLNEAQARERCERLVADIAGKAFEDSAGQPQPHPTVSLGACVTVPDRGTEFDELQRRADAELYQAKRSGGNETRLTLLWEDQRRRPATGRARRWGLRAVN